MAHVALELGCSLVVPLPLDQSDYERDFTSTQSLAEFRALLARAETAFVVPGPAYDTIATRQRDQRSRAYANASAYIVRQCLELIAVWDGCNSDPLEGTAEAVAFQLDGLPEPYVREHDALDQSITGPVIHVSVPRSGSADADNAKITVGTLYPRTVVDRDPAEAFGRLKAAIEQFNREPAPGQPAPRTWTIEATRLRVEGVASIFQRRANLSLAAIFTLVFLAATGYNLYDYFSGHPLSLLVAYIALISTAFIVYLVSRRADWQNRYQDYRALAEALRVAQFWRASGIEDSVAEHFANSQQMQIDWLPTAIRAVSEPPGRAAPPPDTNARENLRKVYDRWIVDQYEYFATIAGRRERFRERIAARIATIGIVCTVALSIVLRLMLGFGISEDLDHALAQIATIVALAAGLVHGFAEKRGWTEHARRYDRMALIFARGQERFSSLLTSEQFDASTMRQARAILLSLGNEAIREDASWLSLHRTRPIAVPNA